MGYPHPDTRARLRRGAGAERREACLDVAAGDIMLHRVQKEQLSTSFEAVTIHPRLPLLADRGLD